MIIYNKPVYLYLLNNIIMILMTNEGYSWEGRRVASWAFLVNGHKK